MGTNPDMLDFLIFFLAIFGAYVVCIVIAALVIHYILKQAGI